MSDVVIRRKGTWIEERSIGSGGFGAVTLWKNEESGKYVAIKKCRLANEMTDKHKKRWQMEVKIMGKLEHENVITALEVPAELDVRPTELPLLAMEYCSGGDLRRLLNMPENCCGLKEYVVRCLIHDVSAGIEYLHSNKIIHRDLKPENIVMKPLDERTIYKIIDLGYAKELDQGSVCTSFVGTLQYLAPELYSSSKYTCTVDFWSFGTVVFECITGYRPFLPDRKPIEWHNEVCKKSPDDICAIVEHGEVKFYRCIPTTNRLSRSMQTYLEQWLRLMLRWDPKARGGGLGKDSRATCFNILETVLNMKIIYLLQVSTNDLLTFPVIDAHTIYDLQRRIEDETQIAIGDQDIIMANGMTPDQSKPATQCWLEPSEQEYFVFLFRHGGENFSIEGVDGKTKRAFPPLIQAIVKDAKTMLPFQEQKRTWAESVVYCEEVHQLFKRLVLSQRAIMLSLLRSDSQFVKTKNKMLAEKEVMLTKIKYFQESLEHDVMFYCEQVNNGGVSSDRMYTKWMKMTQDVLEFKKLENRVVELDNHANALQTRIVELQKSPFAKTKQDDTLEQLAKQAKKAYQDFRQQVRDNRDEVRDNKPIVNIIVKSVMWRDKKLPDLYAHLGKISACKYDLNKLLPEIENCIQEIQVNSKKITEFQTQRQTAVWKLLEIAIQQGRKDQTNPSTLEDMVDLPGLGHVDSTSPGPIYMGPAQPFTPGYGANSYIESVLATPTMLESVQVFEDSRATSKQMENALGELMKDHDMFSMKINDFDKYLGDGTFV
ncbi:inhibitor of nuclear factor kappa-B kinase subunit alpha-like isoform X2 [Dreissena polymorpha]|uniref:IkappaB kinase n=1 Tax=Dreissena polymorpha TaxID=45954 RepID=A0A9D4LPG9_DREPO|nr:inhibitor of nuclear factor kappa-B kinase subunit alpha-like isoform X2 [Dreissena polymorpha]KAH3861372.1 hypothetical protein DPMN_024300 [Dreissena polymorpha]